MDILCGVTFTKQFLDLDPSSIQRIRKSFTDKGWRQQSALSLAYVIPADADDAKAATNELRDALDIQKSEEDPGRHTTRADAVVSCNYLGVQIFADPVMMIDAPNDGVGICWPSLGLDPLFADGVKLEAAIRRAIMSIENARF